MHEKASVRRVATSDHDEFTQLINNYIHEYVKIEKTYPVHFDARIGEAYWKDMNNRPNDYVVMVAEQNGKLVGFCVGEIHRFGVIELVYFEGDRRGEVWDIYVDPKFRSKGFGKLMLAAIEKEFKEEGCKHIVLNGVDMKNPGAKKLYERLGYKAWSIKYFKSLSGSSTPLESSE